MTTKTPNTLRNKYSDLTAASGQRGKPKNASDQQLQPEWRTDE